MSMHGQIWDPKKHGDGDSPAGAGVMGSSMEDADDAASLTSGTGGCDSDRDEDDQLDD
jgi:hypothetical protein